MSKKVLAKKFCSEQDKETPKVMYPQLTPLRKIANLERVINEIREEATIRNNIRLLSEFHKKYIEEIGRIKMIKENEIKGLEKKKKKFKKELNTLESCITSNTKVLQIKMERLELSQQRKRKNVTEDGTTLDGLYWTRPKASERIKKPKCVPIIYY